mgnify:CR=1 FL=1
MKLHSLRGATRPSTLAALVVGLSILLVGCGGVSAGGDKPSDSDGEKAVRAAVAEQSGGKIKLLAYTKLESVTGEMMGVQMHSQDFEGEIQFTEDANWMVGYKSGPFSLQQAGSGLGKPVKKDERVKISGEVEFMKSDSGWKVNKVRCEEP